MSRQIELVSHDNISHKEKAMLKVSNKWPKKCSPGKEVSSVEFTNGVALIAKE